MNVTNFRKLLKIYLINKAFYYINEFPEGEVETKLPSQNLTFKVKDAIFSLLIVKFGVTNVLNAYTGIILYITVFTVFIIFYTFIIFGGVTSLKSYQLT